MTKSSLYQVITSSNFTKREKKKYYVTICFFDTWRKNTKGKFADFSSKISLLQVKQNPTINFIYRWRETSPILLKRKKKSSNEELQVWIILKYFSTRKKTTSKQKKGYINGHANTFDGDFLKNLLFASKTLLFA